MPQDKTRKEENSLTIKCLDLLSEGRIGRSLFSSAKTEIVSLKAQRPGQVCLCRKTSQDLHRKKIHWSVYKKKKSFFTWSDQPISPQRNSDNSDTKEF